MKRVAIFALLGALVFPNLVFGATAINEREYNKDYFDFYIKEDRNNSQDTNGRKRDTTNYKTNWMVNMTDSWEDDSKNDGAITTFWMEAPNGDNATLAYGISEKLPEQYNITNTPALAEESGRTSAAGKTMYLTAENNNDNNDTYRIKGYWDEEL